MRHNDTTKEWGTLRARTLIPSAITYESKNNSRTVQGERSGAGAQQEGKEPYGGMDIIGLAQEGRGRKVNGAARLVGQPGQVLVPANSRGRHKCPRLLKAGDHHDV